ncbi:MAG: VanZ family protein [Bacteroidetes bacterium]|nr:VanZ family protein [Bacteroidota bacterium]
MGLLTHIRALLNKIYVPVLWTLVVITLLCLPGTVLPEEQGFSIPYFDKFIHTTLFGGLVFFWCLYLSSKTYSLKKKLLLFFIFFLASSMLGIGLEFVQKCCIPLRDFSKGDIIADLIGAGFGYGLSNYLFIEENIAH